MTKPNIVLVLGLALACGQSPPTGNSQSPGPDPIPIDAGAAGPDASLADAGPNGPVVGIVANPYFVSGLALTLHELRDALKDQDEALVLSALTDIVAMGESLAEPALPAILQSGAIPGPRWLMGICDCDAGGCTFHQCSWDGDLPTYTGTLSSDGDNITVDLDILDFAQGMSWTHKHKGGFNIADSTLNGIYRSESDGDDGAGTTAEWDWSVEYINAALDENHCPIGGDANVAMSFAYGPAPDFAGEDGIAFSSECAYD